MEASAVSAEASIRLYHPVAGDDDGDVVVPVGPPYSTAPARFAEFLCQLPVARGSPEWDLEKARPDGPLPGSPSEVEVEVETSALAFEILLELTDEAVQMLLLS